MTVRPSLTYFTWLPFCDLKMNPWLRSTFNTCSADGSLGIHGEFAYVNVKRDRQLFWGSIFVIEIDGFFEICRRFVFGCSEAADFKIQATGHNVVAFAIGYVLNFLHLDESAPRQLADRQAFFACKHGVAKGEKI